jgi:hypothetical protein
MFGLRRVSVVVGLVAALTFMGALSTAQAQPYRHHRHHTAWSCRERMERAHIRLDRAIRRHGRHSLRARERRRELHRVRERCWRYEHRWWDVRERRWRRRHW